MLLNQMIKFVLILFIFFLCPIAVFGQVLDKALPVDKADIIDIRQQNEKQFDPINKKIIIKPEVAEYAYKEKVTDTIAIFEGNNIYSNIEAVGKNKVKVYTTYKYLKENDQIYNIKIGRMEKVQFDKIESNIKILNYFKANEVLADSFLSSNDNGIYGEFSSNYNTARTSNTGASLSGSPAYAMSQVSGGVYYLSSGFLNFNTASLPNNITIDNASLFVYSDCNGSGCESGYGFNVYGSDALSSPIIKDDYSKRLNYNTEFSTTQTNNWNTDQWREFELNSNGKNNIDPEGVSDFVIRNVEYDVTGNTPPNGLLSYIRYQTYAGSNEPYLEIEYTEEETGTSTILYTNYANLDNGFLSSYFMIFINCIFGFIILTLGMYVIKYIFKSFS